MERGFRYRWIGRAGDGGDAALALGEGSAGLNQRQECIEATDCGPGIGAICPLVQRVLEARGMTDRVEIQRFLAASLHDLHDPFLLPNITRAAKRIVQTLRSDRPLVIYGDYDVDGITATAILHHVFKIAAPQADIRSYVPHRVDEGYGLNAKALEQLKRDGADLVISVDCGITALEPAQKARELELDLIITDHHSLPEAGAALPDCYCLVHPRLPGSDYPFGDLCGAGVAFKLAWCVAATWCDSDRVSDRFRQCLKECLALVALGTIADVVPLVDENRLLARAGLAMMRHTQFAGLNALIAASGLADERQFDSASVGFRLGPRLNAAGRMGHARSAVRLLTEADADEAMSIARELDRQNSQRQQLERHIFEEACQRAEEAGMTGGDRRIIVLADERWHPGVVGIVCARLVERFGRPAILLQAGPEVYRGSARSTPGYSIHCALKSESANLLSYGGHDMAAGLSVEPGRFDSLVDGLTAHANRHISGQDLVPSLTIDCAADLAELDDTSVRQLLDLGPFGGGNPAPVVLLRHLRLAYPPQCIGSKGKHLALQVTCAGRGMRMIGWNQGELTSRLAQGMLVEVAGRPKLNTWRGRTTIECEILDLRCAEA